MADRYLVLSDLHLCDIEENDDGWRYYKSARFCFDDELERAVSEFVATSAEADTLTLVLNGDVFDFDLVTCVPDDPPWPVSRLERRSGLDPTAEKSAWKLGVVLDHHPIFVSTLAQFTGLGHRVVYVLGNHDRELHFPEVQQVLLDAVEQSAARQQMPYDRGRFVIEPWFFYVPGVIYAEHGQQYDYYNTYRFLLSPTVPGSRPPRLALPMGNLSNRRLLSRMGFFNPHSTDYILPAPRYVHHWLEHYALSRRGILLNWFVGSLIVIWNLIRNKRAVLRNPPDAASLLEQRAAATGIPSLTLRALDHLHPPPITNRFFRVLRELWIDRLLLAMAMLVGTVLIMTSSNPLWVKLGVPLCCFPLCYLVYESVAHGETVFSSVAGLQNHARRIARLLPVQVVTFGHSHHPELVPLGHRVTFVDTGTWAPVTATTSRVALAPGLRNVLTVVAEQGTVQVALDARTQIDTQGEASQPVIELVQGNQTRARLAG